MKAGKLKLTALFLVVASGLLGGCATSTNPVQLSENDRNDVMRSGAIAAIHAGNDMFFFETPAGAMVSGGVATWKDPDHAPTWWRITQLHKVPVFAGSIQNNFLAIIGKDKSSYRFNSVEKGVALDDSEHPLDLAQYGTPYVMEFSTENGVFIYQLFGPRTYMMSYKGAAALVRVRDNQVVWRGKCDIPKDQSPVLTVPGSDFLHGNGEKFRAAAAYVQKVCAEDLAAQFIKR